MQQTMPQQPAPVTPGGKSALGSASLILGIIALIFCILGFISSFAIFFIPLVFLGIFGWIGLILGIIGLILGAVAYWGQWKDKRGMTGFILGLVAIILFVVSIVIGYALAAMFISQMSSYYSGYY